MRRLLPQQLALAILQLDRHHGRGHKHGRGLHRAEIGDQISHQRQVADHQQILHLACQGAQVIGHRASMTMRNQFIQHIDPNLTE